MVITRFTDMFMSIATQFELQMYASRNKIILVLQSLNFRDVSDPGLSF